MNFLFIFFSLFLSLLFLSLSAPFLSLSCYIKKDIYVWVGSDKQGTIKDEKRTCAEDDSKKDGEVTEGG